MTVCIAIAGELNGLSVADNHAPAAAAPAAGIADLFGSEPAARTAPALPTVLTAGVQPPMSELPVSMLITLHVSADMQKRCSRFEMLVSHVRFA